MSGSTNRLETSNLNRRQFLAYFSSIGLSSTLLPGVLWARLQEKKELSLTKGMVAEAEKVAGLEFTDEERELMLEDLQEYLENYEEIRKIHLDNSVVPALRFDPRLPGMPVERTQRPQRFSKVEAVKAPSQLEQVAFWPVMRLAELLRTRQVSSLELTKMYLGRLEKYDPVLECVVTLTEELALRQAKRADEEIAAGTYRGPLHGIPWGAKDLLAARGYKTTWGATTHKDQVIDMDATVVQRLEEAGAVLVAKLTLGALAWGDVWFGGQTKNPWNLEEGSRGSSAGPGAATAAGLVGFSIGSETWGSIVSPSTRCGVTGLRPTFGRVSRHGAMALSWSMDKLGPMCRSVEDCALVFEAIRGPDGKDATVVDVPFNWDAETDVKTLRIGYVSSEFEKEREKNKEWQQFDIDTLAVLRSLGIDLIPIELPDEPIAAMAFILSAEAGAAFDELTHSNRDDLLVRQIRQAWPNVFRHAHMIPAVEYIQANRLRTRVMEKMAELMASIDVYVVPSFGGPNLLLNNLTGHPAVVVPNGFKKTGSPTSISFVGKLYGEAETLALARAYQNATEFHLRHPELES
ncbi:MAG: amidase [bacterium]